jgi:hypothetical protein
MWGEVTNLGSRRTTSSFTKSQGMRGNGTGGKVAQPRISPNNFKARGPNQKEVLRRRGLLSKGAKTRKILGKNPRVHVSIAMRWGITPKIVPSPKWGLGALRYLLSMPL